MRRICIIFALTTMGSLAGLWGNEFVSAQHVANLKINVQYRGEGTVDRGHGIHIFFFDSPDFTSGNADVIPIAMRTVYENGDSVVLEGLRQKTVYLAVAYNESGDYDPPMGPPPSGTPVAVYRMDDPAAPTPIHLEEGGRLVEVDLVFDDANRMP
ncbi:MAG TPA: hypothetical protein VMN76_07375 [Acidobacteriota bacterium]|nr:hypothetical protein [Acidobacteriota bacterium]